MRNFAAYEAPITQGVGSGLGPGVAPVVPTLKESDPCCSRVFIAALAALALSLPVALAADPVRVAPSQRVDLKVLLLSADGTQPGLGAWKAALDREGIPYDVLQIYTGQTRTAPTLTDATFADYGANHAKYQAVIVETGDLGHFVTNPGGTTSFLSALSDAEWATLAKFERSFGIRRLSDFTAATAAHGLTPAGGAAQDGQVGLLTAGGARRVPVPEGAGPDRRRRPGGRRDLRLPSPRRPTRRRSRPCSPGPATRRTWASTRTRRTGARRWS